MLLRSVTRYFVFHVLFVLAMGNAAGTSQPRRFNYHKEPELPVSI